MPPSAKPHFSIPSILAIVCAVISFRSGAAGGALLAIAAIVLGGLGLFLAAMPGVRGGIVSIISVVLGALGIVAAIFKLLF